jgi:hypothetical protein
MAGFSSLFCFLLLLTNVFSASVPQIDIPIYRRVAAVNGRMRARDVARAADTLRARYGYPTASSREQKRQSSDVPITNQVCQPAVWLWFSSRTASLADALRFGLGANHERMRTARIL